MKPQKTITMLLKGALFTTLCIAAFIATTDLRADYEAWEKIGGTCSCKKGTNLGCDRSNPPSDPPSCTNETHCNRLKTCDTLYDSTCTGPNEDDKCKVESKTCKGKDYSCNTEIAECEESEEKDDICGGPVDTCDK